MGQQRSIFGGRLWAAAGIILSAYSCDSTRTAPLFCAVDDAAIDALIASMSPAEKAGQVFMTGIAGSAAYADPDTERRITQSHLGGVVISGYDNIGLTKDSAEKAKPFIRHLQDLAIGSGRIPLFVSMDQEGGFLQNLAAFNGGTEVPGNMAAGAAGAPGDAETTYTVMAEELRILGINMDLAPVLDVIVNDRNRITMTRSFGGTPTLAASLGAGAVAGLQNHGVAATLKHFPGVDSVDIDPHKNLPIDRNPPDILRALNLPSFAGAIRAGADAVMTTHILVPGFDPDAPATLSFTIVTGILREEMGFQGIIMTDNMAMEGLSPTTTYYGDTVEILAFLAGHDILLTSENMVDAQYDNFLAAMASGRIPSGRVDESLRRILRAKMKYCLFDDPMPRAESLAAGRPGRAASSQAVADRSITIVRDSPALLPLPTGPGGGLLVVCPSTSFSEPATGWSDIMTDTLGDEVRKFVPDVQVVTAAPVPLPVEADQAVAAAAQAGTVIVATLNAHFSVEAIQMVQRILAQGKPTILVTLGAPYDCADLPGVGTCVSAYSARTVSLNAAARVLFGQISARGTLPVTLP